MSKFVIAEEAHVAIAKYPATSNGVTTLDAVNMEGYSHISMILISGAAAGTDITATVYASTDASATSAELVAFNYYQETTASTDVLGARVLNSTTALTLDNSATTNIFAVVELDASELPADHNWVNMTLTDSANATNIICCIYVLSGARYGGPVSVRDRVIDKKKKSPRLIKRPGSNGDAKPKAWPDYERAVIRPKETRYGNIQ